MWEGTVWVGTVCACMHLMHQVWQPSLASPRRSPTSPGRAWCWVNPLPAHALHEMPHPVGVATPQEAALRKCHELRGVIRQTTAAARLDWSCSVYPVLHALEAIITEWNLSPTSPTANLRTRSGPPAAGSHPRSAGLWQQRRNGSADDAHQASRAAAGGRQDRSGALGGDGDGDGSGDGGGGGSGGNGGAAAAPSGFPHPHGAGLPPPSEIPVGLVEMANMLTEVYSSGVTDFLQGPDLDTDSDDGDVDGFIGGAGGDDDGHQIDGSAVGGGGASTAVGVVGHCGGGVSNPGPDQDPHTDGAISAVLRPASAESAIYATAGPPSPPPQLPPPRGPHTVTTASTAAAVTAATQALITALLQNDNGVGVTPLFQLTKGWVKFSKEVTGCVP